eukprot:806611-Rhodomonas_salina.1
MAFTILACWRVNSTWVFAPRSVGNPPPWPSPLKKLSTLKEATRRSEWGSFGAGKRGLESDLIVTEGR